MNLGLVPEAGSSYILPRLLGFARASELILLGEKFSADQAKFMVWLMKYLMQLSWIKWLKT